MSKADERAIAELSEARTRGIARREFDRMVDAFYARDARILPSGAIPVSGLEAIRQFWRDAPSDGLVSLSLESGQVVTGGELAYETGQFSRTLRPRHGPAFQEHGKFVVIYRRGDEGWRAEVEMFNTDMRR